MLFCRDKAKKIAQFLSSSLWLALTIIGGNNKYEIYKNPTMK